MRVYHFLSAKNALDDLTRQQIKICEIDELNDPFELWCVAQGDRQIRAELREWKKEMAPRHGMLCFTRHWHSPVLWSHYSDGHRGICLGFEVDAQFLKPVSYVKDRPALQPPFTAETAEQLLYTKYLEWSYEEEVRAWFRLEERDTSTGHCFYSFDKNVQLREVIAGPLCDTPRTTIDAALKGCAGPIRIVKARLAFTTFQVVPNKQGFRRGPGL